MKDTPWTQLAARTREAAASYSLFELAQSQHQQLPEELSEEERTSLLQMVEGKLKLEEAVLASPEAEALPLPTEAYEKAMEELLSRFDSPEEYRKTLETQGFSEHAHRLATERAVAVDTVLVQVKSQARRVSEEELKVLYENKPEAFARPERRKVRHILHVCVNDAESEATREKLQELRSKLEKCFADDSSHARADVFGKTAEMNSQCPSAMKQGLLGTFPRGQLYPELDSVLFEMAPGEIEGPLKTQAGWHLIFLESTEPAHTIPFAEAKEQLEAHVNDQLGKKHQRSWLAARRAAAE